MTTTSTIVGKNLVITGPTGCGKTYRAIKIAREIGGKFAYLAPCRQLVYETYIQYASPASTLSTGEVHIPAANEIEDSFFGVFESHIPRDVKTVIIDEAHFLVDAERGAALNKLIESDIPAIILCSATMTADMRNFQNRAWSNISIPIRGEWKKRKIESNEFWARVEAGEPSIIFRKYSGDCGASGGFAITADALPHERLSAQLAFQRGEIKLIECTNVLAQGLNFPATNILIESNYWDSNELILQKLGRLGRPGWTAKNAELTYCLATTPRIQKQKKPEYVANARDYDCGCLITTWLREAGIDTGSVENDNAIIAWCNERGFLPHEKPSRCNTDFDSSNKYFQPIAIEICKRFDLKMPNILCKLCASIRKCEEIIISARVRKK